METEENDFKTFDIFEVAGILCFRTKKNGDPSFPPVSINSRGGAYWAFEVDAEFSEALEAYHSDTPVHVQKFVRVMRRLRADMLLAKDTWRENCRKANLTEQRSSTGNAR